MRCCRCWPPAPPPRRDRAADAALDPDREGRPPRPSPAARIQRRSLRPGQGRRGDGQAVDSLPAAMPMDETVAFFTTTETRHTSYPVIDEDEHVVGMVIRGESCAGPSTAAMRTSPSRSWPLAPRPWSVILTIWWAFWPTAWRRPTWAACPSSPARRPAGRHPGPQGSTEGQGPRPGAGTRSRRAFAPGGNPHARCLASALGEAAAAACPGRGRGGEFPRDGSPTDRRAAAPLWPSARPNAPPIIGICPAPQKAKASEVIDNLDYAVMAQQQPLRQHLRPHLIASRIAFDSQQRLMLLRRQPRPAGPPIG